jgi:ABC-type Na+ efflux pump permease subunit
MTRWRDRPLTRGMWLATCIVIGLLLAGGVVLYTNAKLDAQEAKSVANRQKEGRAVAIDVLCGFANGVAIAGRNVIEGRTASGGPLPDGAISARERRARKLAAGDYVGQIILSVQETAGVKAENVLIGGGTNRGLIDCAKLRVAARATHP